LNRGLGGPQNWSVCSGEERNLALSGIEPRLPSLEAVAIPTELSDFECIIYYIKIIMRFKMAMMWFSQLLVANTLQGAMYLVNTVDDFFSPHFFHLFANWRTRLKFVMKQYSV
jgi:hypothetical protein